MPEFNLKAIKQRRQELGLSTQEMAEKLGYTSHSVYWKYENGQYKFNADVLPTLAEALQCEIESFYS